MKNCQALFGAHVEDDLPAEIKSGLNTGMALGSGQFKEEVKTLSSRRLKPKKGRPVAWGKKKEKE